MALNIVTICGSTRIGSLNRALMDSLPKLAPAGMTFKESTKVDTIPHYNADVQAQGFPEPVNAFAESLRSADGIIIVTPEYNWTIPGTLKNALDWVSRLKDQPFSQKPVAIQSATGGPLGGARVQYHMRMALTFLNAFTFGTPEVFVGLAQTKFDEKTLELKDEGTKKAIAAQLEGFAKFIERVKA
jgi:chromate reductase